MASKRALAGPATAILHESLWQRFVAMVLHRRVRITAFVFIALLLEDVITRTAPHDLANFHDYRVLLGLGLVFSGLALRSWAAGTLHKRTQLATSGPYALVRHPLYIGSLFMMLGFCASWMTRKISGSSWGRFCCCIFFARSTKRRRSPPRFPINGQSMPEEFRGLFRSICRRGCLPIGTSASG